MKIKTLVMGIVGTNCYIVSDDKNNAVIVDCTGNAQSYIDYIEQNNLKLSHILLTHGHFDHIGCVSEIKSKYDCKLVVAELEKSFLSDPQLNCSFLGGSPVTAPPADILVKDGDELTIGDMHFKVVGTPGHTVGSVCFITNDSMFSGDTLFQGSCGRTDLETGDWDTIVQSLKKLKELDGNFTVYSGHGATTTLDYERTSNPYMQ